MGDVALLLDIISGPDRHDNLTFEAIGHHAESYTAELAKKDAMKGMKLGLPWNPYWSTIAVSRTVKFSYSI